LKKISIIAVAVALLVLASTALADPIKEEAKDSKKLDKVLLKNGYPEEVISWLPLGAKEDLVANDAKYAYHVSRKANLTDEGGKASPKGSSDSGDISTMSLTNFTESMVWSTTTAPADAVKYFVTYRWDWNYLPGWTLTDQVAMAWGGGWAIDTTEPNYFLWQYNPYTVHCPSTGGCTTYMESFSGTNSSSDTPNAGASFPVALKNSITVAGRSWGVTGHSGWARVRVVRGKQSTTTYDNFKGQYFHSQYGCNVALGFSYPASINVVSCGLSSESSPGVLKTIVTQP